MKQWLHFTKKLWVNGGLFMVLALASYHFIFSKIDAVNFKRILENARPSYLILGGMCALIAMAIEGLVLKGNLGLLGQKVAYGSALLYALSGNFFSAITPAASGGQPAVLYFMKKNKMPLEKGVIALLMDLVSYQVAILSLAVVGYLLYFETLHESLGRLLPLLWLGMTINMVLLAVTLCFIFSKEFSLKILALAVKVIHIFSPKKANQVKHLVHDFVGKYHKCACVIRKNKAAYMKNMVLTFMRVLVIYSAPLWVYMSLGMSGTSILKLYSLQACLYISCAALPFPGTIGIGESSFLFYFKTVFAASAIESGMVLSRTLSLYTTVAVSGLVVGVMMVILFIKKSSTDHPKALKAKLKPLACHEIVRQ